MALIPLPTLTPNIATITWDFDRASASMRSETSYVRQVVTHPGAINTATIVMPTLNKTQANDWLGFLEDAADLTNTFLLPDPDRLSPEGSNLGTPLVNGASQTGSALVTDGWNINEIGLLVRGDRIQIDNRMYTVKSSVDSDGAGNATINLTTPLKQSPSDNDPIITTNVKAEVRLVDGSVRYSANQRSHFRISFTVEEVV